MILPDKDISLSESLLGLGSFVLESLIYPKNIDLLWYEFEKVRGKKYFAYHSFDNLILTINMLYAINAIEISEGDLLKRLGRLCA